MIRKITNLLFDRNFVLYATIGISGVIIDFILYLILTKIGLPAAIASIISVSFGIINNFLLNANFNFKRKDHIWRRFISFYAVGATGILLSALIIVLFHNILLLSPIYAKLISVPFIIIFQYWFNKNTAFAVDHKKIPWEQLFIFIICIGAITIFAFNAPYFSFSDEADNLLGSQFIAQGDGLIYKDYFSHHMPLTYFIGAPYFMLLGSNIIGVKVAFGITMSLWLLIMSRHIFKKYGLKIFAFFITLISFTQMMTWSHMLLAEAIISFALIHSIILFLARDTMDKTSYKYGATFAMLGFIPALSALSYLPISILIYAIYVTAVFNHKKKREAFKQILPTSLLSLVPYAIFAIYLYTSGTFSEFKTQAINFNTNYYSQFTSDAATSPIDAIASIIQGSVSSLQNAITYTNNPSVNQPIVFLFAVSILLSLFIIYKNRDYITFYIMASAVVLGTSRFGFTAAFGSGASHTRSGTIISLLGVLLIITTIQEIKKLPKIIDQTTRHLMSVVLYSTLIIIFVSSVSIMSDTARSYIKRNSMTIPIQQPGSSSTVINIVNDPTDYYWTAPIDFSSQLIIDSKNSSIYRFYLPWHAVCPECVSQVISDIETKQPNVVHIDENLSIWGHTFKEYGKDIMPFISANYYKLDDIRLQNFYFLKNNQSVIDLRLSNRGYSVTHIDNVGNDVGGDEQ